MGKRKAFGLIARSSALYFVLINAALLISIFVFHSEAHFAFSLCVICPILGGILNYLTVRLRRKPNGQA